MSQDQHGPEPQRGHAYYIDRTTKAPEATAALALDHFARTRAADEQAGAAMGRYTIVLTAESEQDSAVAMVLSRWIGLGLFGDYVDLRFEPAPAPMPVRGWSKS